MNANRFSGENSTVKMIPTELVRALPQVRTTFKDSSIAELAADIEAHGVLQPLVAGQAKKRSDGKCWILSNAAMAELREVIEKLETSA